MIRQKLLGIFLPTATIFRMIFLQINVIGAYLEGFLGQDKRQSI